MKLQEVDQMINNDSIHDSYKSMQDIVFERLRDYILSGELKPGEPLNTIELSTRLGVSRTPIREALNRLIPIGLVENIPHKGAFVHNLSVKQVIEIYYIRAALSGISVRLAINNITAQMKGKLSDLCTNMETAVAEKDHDLMLEKNFEFHNIINHASNSPGLEALILQYYSQSNQYRALGLELPGRYDEICTEHREILSALVKGDKNEVEFLAREHHFNTARRIAKSIGVEIEI